MIRLGINATSMMSPLTGIGVYTYNLCRSLQETGQCRIFYFYGYRWSEELETDFSFVAAATRGTLRRVAPFFRPAIRNIQQWAFSAGARKLALDLYHEPNFVPFTFNGAVVTTIHDLSVLRYPETHPADRVRFISRNLPLAINHSRQIITVSRFIREELASDYPDAACRINAVHNGLSDDFGPVNRQECERVLAPYGLSSGRYFLCVATIEPRKNLRTVATAYAQLPESVKELYPLVVVGGNGWKVAESLAGFEALKKSGRLVLTGYLELSKLTALYSGAMAFLYPSLYEGFGLPVIEAMACGVPVITSNRSSLPEVAGDAALLVDPENTDAVASAMQEIVNNEDLRQHLIDAGFRRAALYSWEACANETLAVYRRALN